MTVMLKKCVAIGALTASVAISIAAGCSSDPTPTATASPDASVTPEASTSSSSSSSSGSSGVSCLDTTPIDSSTLPYEKAALPVSDACTLAEINSISAYYQTYAGNFQFSATAWASQVSKGCAACVFTDDDANNPPTTWSPILTKNDLFEIADQGGCIEEVSGSFDCGKAFQQLQTCETNACLTKCFTQTDFNACHSDQDVLTTACKGAVDTIQTACNGQITTYQALCASTNFAFEGPIKVGCIAVPVAADAGADGGVMTFARRVVAIALVFLPACGGCSSCEAPDDAKPEPGWPRDGMSPAASSMTRHRHVPFIKRWSAEAGVRDAGGTLE